MSTSLRQYILTYRRLLAASVYEQRSTQMVLRCLPLLHEWVQQGHCQALHTFLPIPKNQEPLTEPLYTWAWQQGLLVYTTQLSAEKTLQHTALTPETKFQLGPWGIPMPLSSPPCTFLAKPLVVLVPLLAFDQTGHRLGYGKGYYDALLADLKPSKALGLALAPPLERLPVVHAKDYKLDACASPEAMYVF